MTDESERQLLIEEATSAWRPRSPDGAIQPHPAWADLAPEDRALVHEEALLLRRLEAALDPEGRSTTVHAVLARLRG